jgi:hypothetical protein
MAPDAAFEAWLAERVDFAATSLLGLTLRPTFDAGWDARAAADRDAAPAAAEGADGSSLLRRLEDAAYHFGFSMGQQGAESPITTEYGLEAMNASRALIALIDGLAARPAPAAAKTDDGSEAFIRPQAQWDWSGRPAPAAAPREDDDFRAGYAQAQSDAMRGCRCEGSKRVSLTVYKGNGREQEVIDCRFCELIPPMFERGAAAREAARGEGEAR